VDLAVDAQLANAPGDQLGVLTPEIEDEDLLVVNVHVFCSAVDYDVGARTDYLEPR
jgi:hypothetical protein